MQIQISEPLMVMKFASKKSILEPEANFCWRLKNAMLFYELTIWNVDLKKFCFVIQK